MKRKILAFTLMLMLAFSSVSLAAVSSSKSAPSSKPSSSSTVRPSTPQASDSSGYKPSAPASSYSNSAPAAQNKTGSGIPAAQQPSSSGGFWRSAGMFGGGMLLGGLMGSMFGYGHPFMGSMAGMLSDLIILVLAVLAIRWAWTRFSGRSRDNNRREM